MMRFNVFEFCELVFLLGEAFFECLHVCSCLLEDLAVCLVVRGHASTLVCVRWPASLHIWWSLITLSLVLQPLLAPFRRLPFLTAHRESCLCTCRLTCLWTDVLTFLLLCTASHWRLAFVYIGLTAVTPESTKLCPANHSGELLCRVFFSYRAACVCAASNSAELRFGFVYQVFLSILNLWTWSGSSQWISGCVDNRSGFGEKDDSNTGEVGGRELVLVFSAPWGARWNITRGWMTYFWDATQTWALSQGTRVVCAVQWLCMWKCGVRQVYPFTPPRRLPGNWSWFPVTSKDKSSILFEDRLDNYTLQVLRIVGFFVVLSVV